jgi:hypothetical protein
MVPRSNALPESLRTRPSTGLKAFLLVYTRPLVKSFHDEDLRLFFKLCRDFSHIRLCCLPVTSKALTAEVWDDESETEVSERYCGLVWPLSLSSVEEGSVSVLRASADS